MGAGEIMKGLPCPNQEMLESPEFEAIWEVIKTWDINVPSAYEGYMGANGNHVRAILDGLRAAGIGFTLIDPEGQSPLPNLREVGHVPQMAKRVYAGESVGWIDATEMR